MVKYFHCTHTHICMISFKSFVQYTSLENLELIALAGQTSSILPLVRMESPVNPHKATEPYVCSEPSFPLHREGLGRGDPEEEFQNDLQCQDRCPAGSIFVLKEWKLERSRQRASTMIYNLALSI